MAGRAKPAKPVEAAAAVPEPPAPKRRGKTKAERDAEVKRIEEEWQAWQKTCDEEGPLKVATGEVAVRMFGQGIGDCFLLAFPQAAAARPYYIVIDCGVIVGTPDPEDRMNKVTYGVKAATGGEVDLLVITHQHWDHISAFQTAAELWKTITIHSLWMAWTENPESGSDENSIKTLLTTVRKSSEKAVRTLAQQAQKFGFADMAPELMARAAFLGVDTDNEGGGLPADVEGTDAIMRDIVALCRKKPDGKPNVSYCTPGQVLPVGETGVRAFVLGPPINYKQLTDTDPGKDGYEWSDGGDPVDLVRHPGGAAPSPPSASTALRALNRDARELTERNALVAASQTAFGATVLGRNEERLRDASFPFAERFRIPWPAALAQGDVELDAATPDIGPAAPSLAPFASYTDPVTDWRRVDFDWLGVAEPFAIAADDLTNNTSLVLAFELPVDAADPDAERPVLLFVGDAQAGNWLSWWDINGWSADGAARLEPLPKPTADGKANIADLLARTVFYKVGHHGSHNASLKARGVEQMGTRFDTLTAFIPVSPAIAHAVKLWCEMPFDPLCRDLITRTDGRVFTPRGRLLATKPEVAIAGADPTVQHSELKLPAKIRKAERKRAETTGTAAESLEPEVPLWIQVRLDAKTGNPV